MRTEGKGNGSMLIKVDLEKAYARISWKFIKETLKKAGLPYLWIKNILHYVKTIITSIVWNGNPLKWFRSSRGIRQGDPISPYLFVLYMEQLGHIISQAVEEGKWKPIILSCHGSPIS